MGASLGSKCVLYTHTHTHRRKQTIYDYLLQSPDVVLEDNLIGASTKLVNPDDPKVQEANANVQSSQGSTIVSYTTEDGKDALFVLLHDPLRVELYHDGVHVLSVNRK